ncbi:MAG: hypothetical protein KC649_02180, partial [Candidatus Omnitrophica bacterium]|nr:hypothetical protein [Candidatus Omnitrophota bacterium]
MKKISMYFCVFYLAWISSCSAAASDTEIVDFTFKVKPETVISLFGDQGKTFLIEADEDLNGFHSSVLEINVLSNTGRPYTIVHNMASEPTNGSGDSIFGDQLMFQINDSSQKGQSLISDPTPVPLGPTKIYKSHQRGGSSWFQLKYL